MQQKKFSLPGSRAAGLPPAALTTTIIIYLALDVAFAYLMVFNPLLGLLGALAVNLVVLIFLGSSLALPLYIVVAGPSIALSLSSSGILSRLYIGNLLFALIVGIWILQIILPERKSGRLLLPFSILVPLALLVLIALISIIYSRLFPDPNISYTYPHSNVSLTVVNISEIVLLIGLPMYPILVSRMTTKVRAAQWILNAYVIVGLLYALGTIFAAPLGLYSRQVILGHRRPEVFGAVSSGLGLHLVLYTCVAFGQALYAATRKARFIWGAITLIFAAGVIMSLGREAWLALVMTVAVMICFRLRNWSALLMIGGIGLLLGLVVLFVPGVSDFFNSNKVYGSDRFKIWQDALSIWQRSPFFGVGAGNYQFFDRSYGTDKVGVAHNQYLEVLAEMGVQGLLCLLGILFAVGRTALKRFNAAKTRLSKGVALSYLGYFIALLMGGFFADSFLPSAAAGGGTGSLVTSSYQWLLLGLVLSITNWEKEAETMEQPAMNQPAAAGMVETTQARPPVGEYTRSR